MKIEDELKIIQARLDKIMAPTPEPKDKFGNTKAQKDKMINDWITRPSTKPYRAALAKKDREQEKFKYTSWANDRTTPEAVGSGISKVLKVPDKAPKAKPMNILKYIDTVKKLY